MNYTKRLFLVVIFFVFLLPLCTDTAEKKKRKRSPDSSEQNRPSKRAKVKESLIEFSFDNDDIIKVKEDLELIKTLRTIGAMLEDLKPEEEAIPVSIVSPDTFRKVLNLLKNELNIENLSERQLVDLINALNFLDAQISDKTRQNMYKTYATRVKKDGFTYEKFFPPEISIDIMPYLVEPLLPFMHTKVTNWFLLNSNFLREPDIIKPVREADHNRYQHSATNAFYLGAGDDRYPFYTIEQNYKATVQKLGTEAVVYKKQGNDFVESKENIPGRITHISSDNALITSIVSGSNYDTIFITAPMIDASVQQASWVLQAPKSSQEIHYSAAGFKQDGNVYCIICTEEEKQVYNPKKQPPNFFELWKIFPKSERIWKKEQKKLIKTTQKCERLFINDTGTRIAFSWRDRNKKQLFISYVDTGGWSLIEKIILENTSYDINASIMLFGMIFLSDNPESIILGVSHKEEGEGYTQDNFIMKYVRDSSKKGKFLPPQVTHIPVVDRYDMSSLSNIGRTKQYLANLKNNPLANLDVPLARCLAWFTLDSFFMQLAFDATKGHDDRLLAKVPNFLVEVNEKEGMLFLKSEKPSVEVYSFYDEETSKKISQAWNYIKKDLTFDQIKFLYRAYEKRKKSGPLNMNPESDAGKMLAQYPGTVHDIVGLSFY